MLRNRVLLEAKQMPAFSAHPNCLVAIDESTFSYRNYAFTNLVDGKQCFRCATVVPRSTEPGAVIFRGDQAASMPIKSGISNYTVLVHAKPDPTKSENDIVGTGATTSSDLLLMCFNKVVRAHQWPSSGGVLVLDSKKPTSEFIGQVLSGDKQTILSLIQGKTVEMTSAVVNAPLSLRPTLVFGGRSTTYTNGFFKGSLYGMRFYDAALTEDEIAAEFINMEERRRRY